jgi:hypothetical protein
MATLSISLSRAAARGVRKLAVVVVLEVIELTAQLFQRRHILFLLALGQRALVQT